MSIELCSINMAINNQTKKMLLVNVEIHINFVYT